MRVTKYFLILSLQKLLFSVAGIVFSSLFGMLRLSYSVWDIRIHW